MTDLENKVLEKILEKLDLDKLIEKIGYDVLTDKIAEKAAELIVQKEYPDQPIIQPISPSNPWINPNPWKIEPYPISPVTVMYGCVPDQFNINSINSELDSKANKSSVTLENDDKR